MTGALFFGLILLSFACWMWMETLSEGRNRGLAKLTAFLLMGSALILPSTADLILIHTSQHFEAKGRIQNLVQRHGKDSFSRFEIEDVDGKRVFVNSAYAGDHLQNGEAVVAKILIYQNTLLSLVVLDGPFADWKHRESDGSLGAWLGIAFGSFFIVGGIRKWKLSPNATETPDSTTPANGIDEQSLLHLNRE
jgi:hypothetical protein